MIVLTELVNGEPMVSSDGMALLFGVSVELVRAHSAKASYGDRTPIPEAWIKAGRRRAREAMAASGRDDMCSALAYWAQKDLGVEVVDLADGGVAIP
jgi:hypothetical protein